MEEHSPEMRERCCVVCPHLNQPDLAPIQMETGLLKGICNTAEK